MVKAARRVLSVEDIETIDSLRKDLSTKDIAELIGTSEVTVDKVIGQIDGRYSPAYRSANIKKYLRKTNKAEASATTPLSDIEATADRVLAKLERIEKLFLSLRTK